MKYTVKIIAVCISCLWVLCACKGASEQPVVQSISLHTELGGNADGFTRACGGREFRFPQDHGPHPEFRNEWWYVTGNLKDKKSQAFGFHATFFRIANRPYNTDQPNSWAASQFYMAHFAITRHGGDQVRAHERFARAAAGLAGAQAEPFRVWLDDWSINATQQSRADKPEWLLKLGDGSDHLELVLTAQKPITLQGDQGYSQKSSDPCNASYYYSVSRMTASGSLSIDGQDHRVDGTAWLDREWSSSALADDQQGWDWFALQLDDGRDIMYYQLRNNNGDRDPQSYAAEIDRTGGRKILSLDDIDLEVTRWWQSDSGSRYPVAGQLRRTDTGEVIHYEPLIDNQELPLTVRYWEGAIMLSNADGESIGTGYLELTGY